MKLRSWLKKPFSKHEHWFAISLFLSFISFVTLENLLRYKYAVADNLVFGQGVVVFVAMAMPIITVYSWGLTIKYARTRQ